MNTDRLNKKQFRIINSSIELLLYEFHLKMDYKINMEDDRFYNLKTKLELIEVEKFIKRLETM